MNFRRLVAPTVAPLSLVGAALPALATSGDTLANARDATAAFTDAAAAPAAGYDLLTDAADIACTTPAALSIHGIRQSSVVDLYARTMAKAPTTWRVQTTPTSPPPCRDGYGCSVNARCVVIVA